MAERFDETARQLQDARLEAEAIILGKSKKAKFIISRSPEDKDIIKGKPRKVRLEQGPSGFESALELRMVADELKKIFKEHSVQHAHILSSSPGNIDKATALLFDGDVGDVDDIKPNIDQPSDNPDDNYQEFIISKESLDEIRSNLQKMIDNLGKSPKPIVSDTDLGNNVITPDEEKRR